MLSRAQTEEEAPGVISGNDDEIIKQKFNQIARDLIEFFFFASRDFPLQVLSKLQTLFSVLPLPLPAGSFSSVPHTNRVLNVCCGL